MSLFAISGIDKGVTPTQTLILSVIPVMRTAPEDLPDAICGNYGGWVLNS